MRRFSPAVGILAAGTALLDAIRFYHNYTLRVLYGCGSVSMVVGVGE